MDNPTPKRRIDSIDALRAFALLGILLTHTAGRYGFSEFTPPGAMGLVDKVVAVLFEEKCRILFSLLFGVSFHLILRNPTYTIGKFCWRCCLLMGFGLANKLVYTSDILLWYGLNGLAMAALPLRRMPVRAVLALAAALYALSLADWSHALLADFADSSRYSLDHPLRSMLTHPYADTVREGLHWDVALNGPSTLAYFLLGYLMGRTGRIDRIDELARGKATLWALAATALAMALHRAWPHCMPLYKVQQTVWAAFYGLAFVWAFGRFRRWLFFLTKYGRLGLTNYSAQDVAMPLLFAAVAIPLDLGEAWLYLGAIGFYAAQCVLSALWLRRYKFGPCEHLWRVATNRRYTPNRREAATIPPRGDRGGQ